LNDWLPAIAVALAAVAALIAVSAWLLAWRAYRMTDTARRVELARDRLEKVFGQKERRPL
jgi:hypothetical protein